MQHALIAAPLPLSSRRCCCCCCHFVKRFFRINAKDYMLISHIFHLDGRWSRVVRASHVVDIRYELKTEFEIKMPSVRHDNALINHEPRQIKY